MKLRDAILEETLESGQSRFENKVAWVRLYLVLSGYIDRSRRGVWTLTDKGRNTDRLSDTEIQSLLLDIQHKGKHSDGIDAVSSTPTAGEDALDDDEAPEEIPYARQLLTILRSLPASGFQWTLRRKRYVTAYLQLNSLMENTSSVYLSRWNSA